MGPDSPAPIRRWAPGAEVRGEGVFIELEDRFKWLDRAGGAPMLEALRLRYQKWRSRRGLTRLPAGSVSATSSSTRWLTP